MIIVLGREKNQPKYEDILKVLQGRSYTIESSGTGQIDERYSSGVAVHYLDKILPRNPNQMDIDDILKDRPQSLVVTDLATANYTLLNSQFNYEETLAKARISSEKLQKELEPQILGKELPPWKCNCGALHHGSAKAVQVVAAGSEGKRYEGQIGLWYLWSVEMRELTKNEGCDYSTGLSDFLPTDFIEQMFEQSFQGIDTRTLETESYKKNPD